MVPRRIPRQARVDVAETDDGECRPISLTQARLSWLQDRAADSAITSMELRLAILLALRYVSLPKSRERFEETGIPVAWPPQTELAKVLGCTRQAVSAAAKRLSKRGCIKITPGGGRGRAAEYSLLRNGNQASCLLSGIKRHRSVQETANSRSVKSKSARQKEQPSSLPHSSLSQSIDQSELYPRKLASNFSRGVKSKYPEFEELFAFWPDEKKDHGKAKGAWINNVIQSRTDPDLVLKRGREWCAYWECEGAGFRTYLGKWLAEHSWHQRPPVSSTELAQMLEAFSDIHAAKRPGESIYDEQADDYRNYRDAHDYSVIHDPDSD